MSDPYDLAFESFQRISPLFFLPDADLADDFVSAEGVLDYLVLELRSFDDAFQVVGEELVLEVAPILSGDVSYLECFF